MSLRGAVTKYLTDWPLIMAIGICCVGAALRIAPLGESLWLDELHTAWCAVGPLDEVAKRAAMGNQAPLFFWLEWLLIGIAGENEFALRLPSLIAGSLLPLALFLFARRWKADAAGLVAAALIAVDPLSIFYATEARPYALVQLLAVTFAALTAEVATRPILALRVAWILVSAVLFHLHYTAALLIAAGALFLVALAIVESGQSPYRWWRLICDQAILALLCLLAAWNVQDIFARRANWAAFIKPLPIWEAIDWTPLPLWWWLVLIIAAGICWSTTIRKTGLQTPTPFLILILSWLVVPLTVAWLATATDFTRLFFARYVAGAFPAVMLLAGLCVQAMKWRWLRLAMGLSTVGVAIWVSGIVGQIQQDGRVIADRNEDWHGCVEWLNGQIAAEGYPVLVYSRYIEADELTKPHDALLDDYCLSPVNSLYPLDVAPSDMFPLPLHQPGQLSQTAEMLTVHRGGCWIVVKGDKDVGRSVASQISSGLKRSSTSTADSHWEIREMHSFGNVQVLQIRNRVP